MLLQVRRMVVRKGAVHIDHASNLDTPDLTGVAGCQKVIRRQCQHQLNVQPLPAHPSVALRHHYSSLMFSQRIKAKRVAAIVNATVGSDPKNEAGNGGRKRPHQLP